jgi:hypothetical protein
MCRTIGNRILKLDRGNTLSWRMVSSGLLRRVALVRTDVSEETGASFIRVTKVGELGTTQAATSNRPTLRRNTKWDRKLEWNNPEDTILHSHRRENLKSYNTLSYFQVFPPYLVFIQATTWRFRGYYFFKEKTVGACSWPFTSTQIRG